MKANVSCISEMRQAVFSFHQSITVSPVLQPIILSGAKAHFTLSRHRTVPLAQPSACPRLVHRFPDSSSPSLAHRLLGSRCRDRARHRRISDSSSACVKSTSACRPTDERSGGKWCLHRLLFMTCDTLRQRLLQHHDSQHAVPIPHTRGGIQ
jgi:hypothetical protein